MRHKIHYYLILFLVALEITSCKAFKKPSPQSIHDRYTIDFKDLDNLNAVIKLAQSKYKLVFMDVSTSWSEPCRIMSKEIYTDKKVADFFNKNFVNYRIDAEQGEGPDLLLKYGIKNYPTFLLLNRRGQAILKGNGVMSAQDLIEFGQNGLELSPTM
jgi:thioredoxin-related protein